MRVALAVAMLFGFFVIVLGLTVGLAGLVVYAFTTGHGGLGAIKLGLLAAVLAAAIGGAVLKAVKIKREPTGVPLTREAQPELWRVVDELAVIAGTRAPDDIRLVGDVNAAVWEETGLLGLRGGKRHLMIGLPLLAGLSVGELRSVLAHELGHYGGGHTKLSALTYRAKTALAQTVENLEDSFLRFPIGGYAKLYAMVAASANRQQELRADQASVAAAGRVTAQNALRKIGPLDLAWDRFSDAYLALAPDAERTPPVLTGFHSFLDDPENGAKLREVEVLMLDKEPKSRFDSHPPSRERIAAMESMTGPEHLADDRPSWVLLAGVPSLERELVRDVGPAADWPEVVALALTARAEHLGGLVANASRGVTANGTLDEVLVALGQGKLNEISNELLKHGTPPSERVGIFTELLGRLLVAELLRQGKASYQLNWGGPARLVLADGSELDDPAAVVGPAVTDRLAVPAVRERVNALCDRTLTA